MHTWDCIILGSEIIFIHVNSTQSIIMTEESSLEEDPLQYRFQVDIYVNR